MRITTIIILSLISGLLKSQNIELISISNIREFSVNCENVCNCYDSIDLDNDILTIKFYSKITNEYNPPLMLKPQFVGDSLFFDHQVDTRFIKDSVFYDTIKHKFDTLYIFPRQSVNLIPDKYSCRKITIKLSGIDSILKYIEYDKLTIFQCPKSNISFDIFKSDTINVINSFGQKHGLWINFYETGEIKEKIYYGNGRFLKGKTYDKEGNDLHYFYQSNKGYSIMTIDTVIKK